MIGVLPRLQRPVSVDIMKCAFAALIAPALYRLMTLKFRKCCTRIEGLNANCVVERRARQACVCSGASPKQAIPERVQFARRTTVRDPYKEFVATTNTLRRWINAVNQGSTMPWLMNISDRIDQPTQFLGFVLSYRTRATQNRFALADTEEDIVLRGRRSEIRE